MKKKITYALLVFISLNTTAQVEQEDFDNGIVSLNEKIISLEKNFNKEIEILQSEKSKLKTQAEDLNLKLIIAYRSIDSLKSQTKENSFAIVENAREFEKRIKETADKNEERIIGISESLSKKSVYGFIALLSVVILSVFLYWLLIKRQKTNKTDIIIQLSNINSSIEERLVKELWKQTEIMENQLRLIESQKVDLSGSVNSPSNHSLAIKVADEITLIERNISLMDSETRGLKQLSRSIEKIKDNLLANGYEIPVLLGKPFNQGMKIVPISTVPDENLEPGVEVISKIIKPQVNFNDKMIQAAQIEVSVGY